MFLYDGSAELVAQGQESIAYFAVPENILSRDRTYLLRTGLVENRDVDFTLQVLVGLPKNAPEVAKPPASLFGMSLVNLEMLGPDPAGDATRFHKASFLPNTYDVGFWVGQAGTAHFEANLGFSSQSYIAVYKLGLTDRNEFLTESDVARYLIDYGNLYTMNNDKVELEVYLEPGAYVVRVVSLLSHSLEINLPSYPIEEIVFSQYFGGSAGSLYQNPVDQVPLSGYFGGLQTTFYHVVAPVASQAGMKVEGYLTTPEGGQFYDRGKAKLSLWKPDAFRGYTHPLPQSQFEQPQIDDPEHKAYVETKARITSATAKPFSEFYVGITRQAFMADIGLQPQFVVPISGKPDLVVDKIALLPNEGETLVQVFARNAGYAPAKTPLPSINSAITPRLP